jgi:hypothetical protein
MPGSQPKFVYGAAVDFTAKCIALEWRARKVEPDDRGCVKVEKLFSGIKGKGVYMFEGRQDVHGAGTVLYIGQTKRTSSLPLRDRMTESFGLFQEDGVIFSDCSDLVIHWAAVSDVEYIDEIERALITSHAPPFNSTLVRRWYEGRNLLVVNAGAKGGLLPVVATAYHAKDGWPT